MKWISVKERLPGDIDGECSRDYVLVGRFSHALNLISIAQLGYDKKWEFMDDNNAGCHSCTGTYELDPGEITHWMPFPDLPEED